MLGPVISFHVHGLPARCVLRETGRGSPVGLQLLRMWSCPAVLLPSEVLHPSNEPLWSSCPENYRRLGRHGRRMQTTAPRPGSRRGRVSRDALPSASTATASPLQPQGARPMTVAAMRAAVIAIRAGVFDDVSDVDVVCGGPAPGATGA